MMMMMVGTMPFKHVHTCIPFIPLEMLNARRYLQTYDKILSIEKCIEQHFAHSNSYKRTISTGLASVWTTWDMDLSMRIAYKLHSTHVILFSRFAFYYYCYIHPSKQNTPLNWKCTEIFPQVLFPHDDVIASTSNIFICVCFMYVYRTIMRLMTILSEPWAKLNQIADRSRHHLPCFFCVFFSGIGGAVVLFRCSLVFFCTQRQMFLPSA